MSRPAVVVLYVVPLLLTAAFLASVGLGVLAVALLAVEAVVAGALWAARRPDRPARTGAASGSTVLLAGAGVLVLAAVGLLVLLRATSG